MAAALRKLTLTVIAITSMIRPAWAEKIGEIDPETKVEISIFDLIPQRPRVGSAATSAKLDAGYVAEVIRRLREHRADLLSCLDETGSVPAHFHLSIAATGEAQVRAAEGAGEVAECAAERMASLKYPTHHLPSRVEIELPLTLKRSAL